MSDGSQLDDDDTSITSQGMCVGGDGGHDGG